MLYWRIGEIKRILRNGSVAISVVTCLVACGGGGSSPADTQPGTTSGSGSGSGTGSGSGSGTTTVYALSVTTSGGGSVTSSPAGISCSATCSANFNSGTTVTLTATPNSGYTFSGWSGACSGTATCLVSMNQAQSVTANFAATTLSTYTLSVTSANSGGTITSNPAGLNCSTSCSASFSAGSTVTLSAAAASGYTFSGWSGACSGTGTCSVSMNQAQTVTANFTANVSTGAPVLLYTDALSGPTSGGENNLGAYLSVFGKNFGAQADMGSKTKVYIGGKEVANYRYLGPSKVAGKLGIQQITVQVGALGGAAQGTALPVKVMVSGVSSNTTDALGHAITFTPNPGRILFVSLSGNDATAVPNDITKPWRHLQLTESGDTPSGPGRLSGGIYPNLKPGDHVVIRGGNWSDVGFDATWIRFGDSFAQGSAPTGASNTGWIHFTAYPGPVNGNAIEDVHYSTPNCATSGNCGQIWVENGYKTVYGYRGGFQGPSNAAVNNNLDPQIYTGTVGQYISISNLHLDVPGNGEADAAPINIQNASTGHWRIVNNELGPWRAGASSNMKGAGVSGHGDSNMVLGNHIHDIEGTSALENHGIYADDTAQNWEIAYNWIHDIRGGSLVQLNDSGQAKTIVLTDGSTWQGFVGFRVHHNWLEKSAKYGLNIASSTGNARNKLDYQAWNNVIVQTSSFPIRVQSFSTVSRDATFAYNTIYNQSGGSAFEDASDAPPATGSIRIYNNLAAMGPNTVVLCNGDNYWFTAYDGISAALGWDFRNNLYFDNHLSCGAMILPGGGTRTGVDAAAITADPLFNAPSSSDFTLQTSSPAIDAALRTVPMTVTDDFTSSTARPQGAHNDVGAFEH